MGGSSGAADSWLDSPAGTGGSTTPFFTGLSFGADQTSQVVWPGPSSTGVGNAASSSSPEEEMVPVSQNPGDLRLQWPPPPSNHNPAWPAAPPPLPAEQMRHASPATTSSYIQQTPSPVIPSFPPNSFQLGPGHGPGPSPLHNELGVGTAVPEPSELRRIMQSVKEPYDYTEGYHFLMRFLKERYGLPYPLPFTPLTPFPLNQVRKKRYPTHSPRSSHLPTFPNSSSNAPLPRR